jgi:hypothetical protein
VLVRKELRGLGEQGEERVKPEVSGDGPKIEDGSLSRLRLWMTMHQAESPEALVQRSFGLAVGVGSKESRRKVRKYQSLGNSVASRVVVVAAGSKIPSRVSSRLK